jgi:hypothetical protein
VQQRVIAGYAQMNGLVVDRVFVERGVSGSKPLGDRPHRMFRSALDALEVLGRLKQAGVSLHMIDLGGDTTGNGVSNGRS